MANQSSDSSDDLIDLQCHSPIASLFKYDWSYIDYMYMQQLARFQRTWSFILHQHHSRCCTV